MTSSASRRAAVSTASKSMPFADPAPISRSTSPPDLRRDGFREAPFLTSRPASRPAASRAWHKPSLTSTSSAVSARSRLYSSICARVSATASRGIARVSARPFTLAVSTQFGPCPGSPSRAQWQPGLPHLR